MTKSKVIGLKIEYDRPEDSIKSLAIQLANYLQQEINAKGDAKSFREQAVRERTKAKEFGNIMIMLAEYNRKKEKIIKAGKEWKPSRMEPMESYDMDMIKEERMMLVARARNLDDQADEHEKTSNKARREIAVIQKKLMEVS